MSEFKKRLQELTEVNSSRGKQIAKFVESLENVATLGCNFLDIPVEEWNIILENFCSANGLKFHHCTDEYLGNYYVKVTWK